MTSRSLLRALSALFAIVALGGCDDSDVSGAASDAEDSVERDTSEDADGGSSRPDVATLPLPSELVPTGDEFIVAVLPDTQIYAEQFPETFMRQLEWLAVWAEDYRIEFVSHVGDIVQNGAYRPEWLVARAAYDYLEDYGVPHGFALGGHDRQGSGEGGRDDFKEVREPACEENPDHISCVAPGYFEFFDPAFFSDREWYGDVSPSGRTSYQVIEVEGLKLMFLHVAQNFADAEVQWASEALDANPGTLVHVTTHKYMFDFRLTEVFPFPLNLVQSGRNSFISEGIVGANNGGSFEIDLGEETDAERFHKNFISVHPNIWGLHCGHIDAEFWQETTNGAGLPVHEVLVDFQDMVDGGGGWLRLLKFKPSEDEVQAITFSTETGRVREDGEGFEHSIDVLEAYAEPAKDALVDFGLTREDVDGILEDINRRGGTFREEYRESLYGGDSRNSVFTMPVDFDAYMEASE